MAETNRRGVCAHCRQVVPLSRSGRLVTHVPAGLAARGPDGERCLGVLPRLGGLPAELMRTA